MPKAYSPGDHEEHIYKEWEEKGYFKPRSAKKHFSISLPPPNATGELHIGHAMMLALQDIMVRYHRMAGDETVWTPGIDHAAIATQNKVESILLKQGIRRQDIGREGLLKEIEAFVEKSRSTIERQIRKMGSSCDWSRERYTLDPGLSKAVREVFVRMYNDELIYRGERIVNWCIRCASTLADDEVDHKEQDTNLYYIKYGPLTVATTRPETKLGDTALAVHPDDSRYKEYVGKELQVVSADGMISLKVIADTAVDPSFGTGVIKVTPGHDMADFDIGKRHNLEIRQVIGQDGRMTKEAGNYSGMKVKECRAQIILDLDAKGLLEKTEPYHHSLTVCYRCGTPIEPLVSKQWFVDVHKKNVTWKGKKESLRDVATKVVKEGTIKIIPDRFEKIYFHWMNNLHDWCISRQLWFGHRLPVWYCDECSHTIVAVEIPTRCTKCKSTKITQDPDTLDTWFSSSLWTFSTLGWPEKTEDLKKFHPTSVMETGYDILFFWVARMIIMTTYTLHQIPFKQVYLHGLVRDKEGRKMSKSLNNGIDPVAMIQKFGADAVRLSLVMGTTPGQDTRLYEEKIAGHRNFVNKVWNMSRFVLSKVSSPRIITQRPIPVSVWDGYILSRLDEVIKETTTHILNFRFSLGAESLIEFTWHEFADWYIEVAKIEEGKEDILLYCVQHILTLLHPYTPYVTEALWEKFNPTSPLIISSWPLVSKKITGKKDVTTVRAIMEFVQKARQYKVEHGIPHDQFIKVYPLAIRKVINANKKVINSLARIEIVDTKKDAVAM